MVVWSTLEDGDEATCPVSLGLVTAADVRTLLTEPDVARAGPLVVLVPAAKQMSQDFNIC